VATEKTILAVRFGVGGVGRVDVDVRDMQHFKWLRSRGGQKVRNRGVVSH